MNMSEFTKYLVYDKEINVKCLIVSGGLASAVYYLPKDNDSFWAVFFASYICLAWYDHYALCDYKLSATTVLHPLTAFIKPAVVNEKYE